MYKEVGLYFLDVSKLIFAGVVLAGLLQRDINPFLLLSMGSLTSAAFAWYGFSILRNFNKTNKK
jgi:uncharacterized membrane protein YraQ (UPF0718 family)